MINCWTKEQKAIETYDFVIQNDYKNSDYALYQQGMVYGLQEKHLDKIKNWVAKGNTIIAIGTANNTLIKHKIIDEKRVILKKDSTTIAQEDLMWRLQKI